MKHFEVSNAHQAYPSLLQFVLKHGTPLISRVGDTVEVEDVSVCFVEPVKTETPRRAHSAPLLGLMEGLQLTGSFEADALMRTCWPKYFDYSDNWGNYGRRAANKAQLKYVFDELSRDPNTRRAVVTLWDPQLDVPGTHTDHPCTISIMFRVRAGHLNMAVSMRSQDMWLGHPYDVIQFATLQQTFATALGLVSGTYTHHMGSCHIYIRDIPAIQMFLDEVGIESLYQNKYSKTTSVEPLSEEGWNYTDIQLECERALGLDEILPVTDTGKKILAGVEARRTSMTTRTKGDTST